MVKTAINELKNSFLSLMDLFLWLSPLVLFLLVTYLPKTLWNLSFKDYLDFLNVLVWPCTVLIILFFFKKVVTYLFFSMNRFNFFGIKGDLKNVNKVILEEVDRKFLEEKYEEKRREDIKKLNIAIKSKETEIEKVKGSADKSLVLAEEIMKNWKESSEISNKIISGLESEIKELKKNISSTSPSKSPCVHEESDTLIVDDSLTSDSISEESNITK